tara:strand:- start:306 stop:410 length:105 start_codon:yes stop_codon:yes gene_type:complete
MLTLTPAEPSTSILFQIRQVFHCWIKLFGVLAMV